MVSSDGLNLEVFESTKMTQTTAGRSLVLNSVDRSKAIIMMKRTLDSQTIMKIYQLVEECAKLDPEEERQLAEEGMSWEIDAWLF